MAIWPVPYPPVIEEGFRVLVCGGRNWTDQAVIKRELSYVFHERSTPNYNGLRVIHGGAKGADNLAGIVAGIWSWPVEVYSADWATHGKGAGPIRNQQMLDQGKPQMVLAFPDPGSRGTWDMIRRAVTAGVETRIFSR